MVDCRLTIHSSRAHIRAAPDCTPSAIFALSRRPAAGRLNSGVRPQRAMIDPDTILGFAFLIALLLLGTGSWLLHQKLRTKASLALLSSLAISAAWVLVLSQVADHFILGAPAVQADKSLLNIVFITVNIGVPALLIVAFSAAFFALAKSLRPAV